jgi:hypothetical protein
MYKYIRILTEGHSLQKAHITYIVSLHDSYIRQFLVP